MYIRASHLSMQYGQIALYRTLNKNPSRGSDLHRGGWFQSICPEHSPSMPVISVCLFTAPLSPSEVSCSEGCPGRPICEAFQNPAPGTSQVSASPAPPLLTVQKHRLSGDPSCRPDPDPRTFALDSAQHGSPPRRNCVVHSLPSFKLWLSEAFAVRLTVTFFPGERTHMRV